MFSLSLYHIYEIFFSGNFFFFFFYFLNFFVKNRHKHLNVHRVRSTNITLLYLHILSSEHWRCLQDVALMDLSCPAIAPMSSSGMQAHFRDTTGCQYQNKVGHTLFFGFQCIVIFFLLYCGLSVTIALFLKKKVHTLLKMHCC